MLNEQRYHRVGRSTHRGTRIGTHLGQCMVSPCVRQQFVAGQSYSSVHGNVYGTRHTQRTTERPLKPTPPERMATMDRVSRDISADECWTAPAAPRGHHVPQEIDLHIGSSENSPSAEVFPSRAQLNRGIQAYAVRHNTVRRSEGTSQGMKSATDERRSIAQGIICPLYECPSMPLKYSCSSLDTESHAKGYTHSLSPFLQCNEFPSTMLHIPIPNPVSPRYAFAFGKHVTVKR